MQAGVLTIDFITNLSKIQGELSQIKRAVGQTMGEAVASYNSLVRSADGMVASLERQAATHGKTAEQIRQMDVAAKALALQEAGLTEKADRLRAAEQSLQAVQVRGTAVTGGQRAGLQQLVMNMGDVSTSYAGGAKISMIFAQQSGQVAQAISLAAGESSAFARILGGPYLIAITAAITLVMALAGASEEVKTKAEKEADALKTVTGSIDALDDATGRLHKSKQQEIADSAAAARGHLAEALANRQLLATKLEGFKAGSDAAIGGTVGGGAQFAAAASAQFTASSIAANEAAIRKLQASLGGVGFANAVDKASAATNQAAAATQAYEKQLARIQAAWDRSGKTAHDQVLVTQLVTDAMKKRDEATRSATGGMSGMIDANAQVASATNNVQRAEAALAKVRAQNAIDLAAHNITSAQATERLTAARTALYQARDAAKAYRTELVDQGKATREAAKEARAAAEVFAHMNRNNFGSDIADMSKGIESAWAADWVDTLKEIANARKVAAAEAAEAVQADMEFDRDRLAQFHDQVRNAANDIADSWGKVGASIGNALSVLLEYGDREKELAKQRIAAGGDQKKLNEIASQSADDQLSLMMGLTQATEGLFKKHSAGARAAQAAEKALSAVELARTAIDVAGGAAKMFQVSGPAGFGLVAAMLAVMASLGFHGGGGASAAPTSNQGTGTVLGDNSAQSDSIKRSIDLLSDVDRVTMTYSAQMASSLKNIESELGGVASLLVRSGNINGASGGVTTGFGSSLTDKAGGAAASSGIGAGLGLLVGGPVGAIIGGALGAVIGSVVKGLFGTKTSVVGSGLYGGSQDLSSILNGGFDLQTYVDVQKKKKLFGLTTSTKYSTQYGTADPQLGEQFALILKQFDDAISAAAGPLGVATDDVTKRLDGFVVSIGKIDFTGLSGDEIQKKLEAVFGATADAMAAAALPGLEKFQQVGEGYFDTLVRVANTVEAVTVDLNQLGKSTAGLGIDAKMAIASMFDSTDSMNSAVQAYFQTYYTDAEQLAVKTTQLNGAFTSLGLAMPTTLAGFRALVDAQDLTTAAGQSTYAMLIQLAPAFAQIASGAQSATSAAAIIREAQDLQSQLYQLQGDTAAQRALELSKLDPSNRALQQRIYELTDEKAALDAANAVAQQRSGLESQLLQLQGNTAAIRAAELAQLYPANRALQEQIYALQDQQAAAAAAAQAAQEAAQKTDQLRQAWSSIGDTIEDEINRIRNLTGSGSTSSFATLMAQFNAATDAARHGDQSAASSLPQLSKDLLDAAAQAATSQQELNRIQGMTAASLEATLAMIHAATGASSAATAPTLGADTSAADSANWWSTYAPSNSATADLKSEVAGLRNDVRHGLAAIAGHTKKTARILDDTTNGDLTMNTLAA